MASTQSQHTPAARPTFAESRQPDDANLYAQTTRGLADAIDQLPYAPGVLATNLSSSNPDLQLAIKRVAHFLRNPPASHKKIKPTLNLDLRAFSLDAVDRRILQNVLRMKGYVTSMKREDKQPGDTTVGWYLRVWWWPSIFLQTFGNTHH